MSWWKGVLSHPIQITGRDLIAQVVAPEMLGCWEICKARLAIYHLTMGRREGEALLVVYFAELLFSLRALKKGLHAPMCAICFTAGQSQHRP